VFVFYLFLVPQQQQQKETGIKNDENFILI
jgi:hypothetical protein